MVKITKEKMKLAIKNVAKATAYGTILYLLYFTLQNYILTFQGTPIESTLIPASLTLMEGYIILTILAALTSQTKLSPIINLIRAFWVTFSTIYLLDSSTITLKIQEATVSINLKQAILLWLIPAILTLITALFKIIVALHKHLT
ncbi:MAG: hypothetical protein ACTSV6_01225 [Candidatus Heimdallarchaeota archaeon]